MATDRIKSNENVYFRARKEAAIYNEKLNSRGNAADVMGISESSLADYELGLTKVVPVDKVVLMAYLYKSPWLKTMYCKTECPIGRCLPIPTESSGIETVTLDIDCPEFSFRVTNKTFTQNNGVRILLLHYRHSLITCNNAVVFINDNKTEIAKSVE